MTKRIFALVLCGSLFSSALLARSQKLPPSTPTTKVEVTSTTLINSPTIQSIGSQAKQNSNRGQSLANAAMVLTAAGAAISCSSSNAKGCKYFLAGLAASIIVKKQMGKASGVSTGTMEAVTTDADPYNLNTQSKPGAPPTPSYENEPEFRGAMAQIAKAKKEGWKIDLDKGTLTPPNGKPFSTAVVSSSASMKADGASPATIAAYESAMSKIPALAAEKLKAADAKDSLFDDATAGGGGAPSPTTAADGALTPYGSLATGSGSGSGLGINRDPAQVAGMKKDFNGEPIGISQDSLFLMIDRRYQLHHKNGSFLSP